VSEISIRPASLPLAPVLATLHAESFGAEGWSFDQIRGSLALTTTKAWIAYHGQTPVGLIFCQLAGADAEILTLCVQPAMRRKGIAALILRRAVDEIRAAGVAKIMLEVAADNIAARRLYEHFGFIVIGARANYYKRGAVTVDGVMYAL
jgi:ribosomal-protein-alanine N-acetyltransferase